MQHMHQLPLNPFSYTSVAIDGQWAAARFAVADQIDMHYEVLMLHKAGNSWQTKDTLVAPNEQHSSGFGESISISGNTLVSGAHLQLRGQLAGK